MSGAQDPHQENRAAAVATGSSPGKSWFSGMNGLLLVSAVAVGMAGLGWRFMGSAKEEARETYSQRVGSQLPYTPPPQPVRTATAAPIAPAPAKPAAVAAPPPPPPPAIPPEAYRASARVGSQNGAASEPRAMRAAATAAEPDNPETALAKRLQPSKMNARQAAPIPDPAWMIRPGTPIPCVLETAIDSTLEGMIVCTVTRDVYGSTGTLKLLARGTTITGETRADMKQGQRRLFIAASTAMTPDHTLIDLDSIMTDPLGRTGVDGEVDTHLGERITGALLLGLASDGVAAGMSAAMSGLTGGEAGTTVRIPGRAAGGVDSALAEAFRNSVNIPPTLRKNQGELVSIMVARWLDFRPAYTVSVR